MIAFAAVVASRAGARAALKVPPQVTKTVMLVGDSVPKAHADEFADAAAERGYDVISAATTGCPATGVGKVYSSGKRFRDNTCAKVIGEQDKMIKRDRPALVIWWSRYELAPRLGPGREGLAPRLQGAPAGATGIVRGSSAGVEEARSTSRHGADRASRPASGSPQPLGEVSSSSGRRFSVGRTS